MQKKNTRGKTILNVGLIDAWLGRFFEGITGIDERMWRYTLESLIDSTKDAGISYKPKYKYADLATELRRNAAVFAAFKNHDEQKALAALLVDDEGKPRSKAEFIKLAKPIAEQYNVDYLKTEVNMAQASAQMAIKWEGFAENEDLYPNLRYDAVGDSDTRPEHARLDGLVYPINDPFWNRNYPPNGWNCRCSVTQTDEPVSKNKPESFEPDKGFDMNPGKDRKLFSDKNGYQTNATKSDQKDIEKQAGELLDNYLKG